MATRDPYQVLGIPKSASAPDVKKAFRKLAKAYHPDQSKDPKAKDKFAEINSAYEIVGDDAKRAQFDRGEIDADGKPKFQGFEGFSGRPSGGAPGGGFEGFEFNVGGGRGGAAADIFADLFGSARSRGARAAPPKGDDVAASVTISLSEAVRGTSARVTLPTGKTLDIRVPAGIEDGKQIRLKGQGAGSPFGGEPGDAMVTVKVATDPAMRVEGRDIRVDLPITLYEAVLGAKVPVPTLDGAVEMSIPAGTNGGKTLRLRGKGLPAAGGGAGDLLVTLRLVLPDGTDPDLQALMRRWAESKTYDPRRAS